MCCRMRPPGRFTLLALLSFPLLQLVALLNGGAEAQEPKACMLPAGAVLDEDAMSSNSFCITPGARHGRAGVRLFRSWIGQIQFLPRILEVHHLPMQLSPPPFVQYDALQHLELYNVDMAGLKDTSLLGLRNVQSLEIRNTMLPSLPEMLFAPMQLLRHLTLQCTSSVQLPSFIFMRNTNIRTMYLSQSVHIPSALPQSASLLIADEAAGDGVPAEIAVRCTCKLLPFLSIHGDMLSGILSHSPERNISEHVCNWPHHLEGRTLASLSKEDICPHAAAAVDDEGARAFSAGNTHRRASVRHVRSVDIARDEARRRADTSSVSTAGWSSSTTPLSVRSGVIVSALGCLCFALVGFLCCKSDGQEKKPQNAAQSKHKLSGILSRTHARADEAEEQLFEPELTPEELEEIRLAEEERLRQEEEAARIAEEERLWQEEEDRKRLEEEERWRKIKEEREEEARKENEQQELSNGLRRALTVRRTVLRDPVIQRRDSSDSDSWSSSSDSSGDDSSEEEDDDDDAKPNSDNDAITSNADDKKKTKKKKKEKKKKKKANKKKSNESEVVDIDSHGPEPDAIPMGIVERMAKTLAEQKNTELEAEETEGTEAVDLTLEVAVDGDAPSADGEEQEEAFAATVEDVDGTLGQLVNIDEHADTGNGKNETAVDVVKEEVMRRLMSLMGTKGDYGGGNLNNMDPDMDCDFGSDEFDSYDDDEGDGNGNGGSCTQLQASQSKASVASGEYSEPGPGNNNSAGANAEASMPSTTVHPASPRGGKLAIEAAMRSISVSDMRKWNSMSEAEKDTLLTSTVSDMKKKKKEKRQRKEAKRTNSSGALKKITRAVSMRRKQPAASKKSDSSHKVDTEEITERDLKEWEGQGDENDEESRPRTLTVSGVPLSADCDVTDAMAATCGLIPSGRVDGLSLRSDGNKSHMGSGTGSPVETSCDFLDQLDTTADTASVSSAGNNNKLSASKGAGSVVRRLSMRKGRAPSVSVREKLKPKLSDDTNELNEVDDWAAAKIGQNW